MKSDSFVNVTYMKKKLSRPKNKDDEEDTCGYLPGT